MTLWNKAPFSFAQLWATVKWEMFAEDFVEKE